MRKEYLFNDDWEFVKLKLESSFEDVDRVGMNDGKGFFSRESDSSRWSSVVIPHDWLIEDTDKLYEDGCGWYRKLFHIEVNADRRYLINFDGVYMNSTVYVNRREAGTCHYGYSAFEYDITDLLKSGENEILVCVRYQSPNTRWYSGAGIFRDVYFKEVPCEYIATDGVYVSAVKTEGQSWSVHVDTETIGGTGHSALSQSDANTSTGKHIADTDYTSTGKHIADTDYTTAGQHIADDEGKLTVECRIEKYDIAASDSETSKTVSAASGSATSGSATSKTVSATSDSTSSKTVSAALCDIRSASSGPAATVFSAHFDVENPELWDVDSPKLYIARVSLMKNGKKVDEVTVRFGFRDIRFTTDDGFFLNGRKLKLNGVCEHHDLGCLGSAFSRDAMKRKIQILKSMGVNAIRTSHNMPAKGFMDLAEEMGILVDSEAFDMWRHPKTEYDYARFFNEDYEKDVTSWVRRDRNSPAVIMWSIGNEIYDCHADADAPEMTEKLMTAVRKSDYRANAYVTMGSNYMPWEGAQKCTDVLKLAGYNYGEKCYDAHHEKYKDWMIYGSETSSTVQSRGVYHFPYAVSVMADDDEQCSTLGNCSTSWGAPNSEYVIKAERDHAFSAGQFLWSGFDYIGEPTPYHTRNSYFGQIDTAGFAKDTFYIYKGAWTDYRVSPFVHVFPYWDFNEGQLVDVRVATNAPSAELFLNGVSLGRKQIDHAHGDELVPTWQTMYHAGVIEAVAYDGNGNEIAREARKSFGDAAAIRCTRFELTQEKGNTHPSENLIFIEIHTEDAEGNPVENDNSRIKVEVKGGSLLGLDNGDSTEEDQYKTDSRRLFAGKLLAVIKADSADTVMEITLSSQNLKGCRATCIYSENGLKFEAIEADVTNAENASKAENAASRECENDIPIRKIELLCDTNRHFDDNHREKCVRAVIHPANASFDRLEWSIVNDYAVKSNLAEVLPTGISGEMLVKAKGDGTFRLRCCARNGNRVVKVMSVLEFDASGLGTAYLDPYDFIAGSLYSDSKGDIGNGNEKGVATGRGTDCYVGYENIDFGDFGSDEVTVPIFALSGDEYRIDIWEGCPGREGSRLLCHGLYKKPTIWNVYQEETFKLTDRIKGISSVYFVTDDKIHIKGFSFTKLLKSACVLKASDRSRIYGDTFTPAGDEVRGIGNNVTIEFDDMDFTDNPVSRIHICGNSPIANNSIHFKCTDANGSSTTLMEFAGTDGFEERSFEIPSIASKVTVGLVFLPGCNFDLRSIRFS